MSAALVHPVDGRRPTPAVQAGHASPELIVTGNALAEHVLETAREAVRASGDPADGTEGLELVRNWICVALGYPLASARDVNLGDLEPHLANAPTETTT